MALKHIRLELARDPDFPDGSAERGYDFYAPLTADGQFDAAEWKGCAEQCTVHRFWLGEGEERGHLVHRGSGWAFHYEGSDADPDEPIFKFDRHTLVQGEYISITEHDGTQRTFRVAMVR